jgi:hypothetical protein
MSKRAARSTRGSFQERLHRFEARALFIGEVARACPPVFDEFQALAQKPDREREYATWCRKWHLQLRAPEDWLQPIAWVIFRRYDRQRSTVTPLMLARLAKENLEFEARKAFSRALRPMLSNGAAAVERMPFETDAAFLKRARAHSRTRGEILSKQGLGPRSRPTLAEHVGWFVRFQLNRESYAAIHASLPSSRNITRSAVRSAIGQAARLLGFTLRTARA